MPGSPAGNFTYESVPTMIIWNLVEPVVSSIVSVRVAGSNAPTLVTDSGPPVTVDWNL